MNGVLRSMSAVYTERANRSRRSAASDNVRHTQRLAVAVSDRKSSAAAATATRTPVRVHISHDGPTATCTCRRKTIVPSYRLHDDMTYTSTKYTAPTLRLRHDHYFTRYLTVIYAHKYFTLTAYF